MVHQHGLRHLVRRQRNRFDEQEEDSPVVEMATVVVTMPNTFTGEVIWVTRNQDPAKTSIAEPVEPTRMPDRDPLVRPKPSSVEDDKATPTPTATAGETSDRETSESATVTTRASSSRASSSLLVDTSSPPSLTTTGAVGTVAAAITSSAASSTPSAEAASSGMSGGAKAGLALGILVLVGALLGAILFIANRKKKERAGQQLLDNEKASMHNMSPPPIAKDPPPPPPPQVISPVVKTQESAPQLSLRPVTQFDPAFPAAKGGSSGGNMLGVAAGNRSPSPDRPSSSWERPGATNATVAPVNPFNDPQPRSNSPPQDPFSNNAAIETSPFPNPPSADFGNPAPAIAAAEKAPATAPLPSPPVMSADNPPSSPAWTDDIPASPGPAPSGPLPVAGAGGASTVPNNVHRIQLDFNPSMADELGLRAGQLVRMLHEYDDGWALCVRLDRSQQGVAPRTCLSKHPVKPRQGPPGTPRTRGPMGPNATQPRPLSPASGRSSPHPPSLSPAQGRMSPGPRAMSPGPRQMPPGPRQMSPPQGRARSHSNAPRAGPPRSMSPGPYGGGPQMAPPQKVRPRSNSASQVNARRASPPGPSPMNPNANMHMPARKPIPGQAL